MSQLLLNINSCIPSNFCSMVWVIILAFSHPESCCFLIAVHILQNIIGTIAMSFV